MVAGYIGAANWFNASTSLANPAVAWARMLSDTFAGIAPDSVDVFVAAELAGAGLAALILRGPAPALSHRLRTGRWGELALDEGARGA